jgi:hypothetical protein
MNENEQMQKQWLQDLAAEGLSQPKIIHIAIHSQKIHDDVRGISDRLSECLRKTAETGA